MEIINSVSLYCIALPAFLMPNWLTGCLEFPNFLVDFPKPCNYKICPSLPSTRFRAHQIHQNDIRAAIVLPDVLENNARRVRALAAER
jgi:hypothetical protein